MFDVGFSELVLIALIALIVLGPKRLPEVARTAGRWLGKLRRFLTDVKQDLDRELHTAELDELRKLKEELNETRRIMEESSTQLYRQVTQEVNAAAEGGAPASPQPPPAVESTANPSPVPLGENAVTPAEGGQASGTAPKTPKKNARSRRTKR